MQVEIVETNTKLSWLALSRMALEHRRQLLQAQCVAVGAVLASVPIPLLMPLLVDEVLLQRPAALVAASQAAFPAAWHGPVLYISLVLLLTILLRVMSLTCNVWQGRTFSLIAKNISFHIRQNLLNRLQTVSMSEFETLGSGSIASHLVTDVNAVDDFIGQTVSRALISVLSLIGISGVLLWMHWQLALFILVLNPLVIYFTMKLGKRVKQLKKQENSAFEIFQQTLGDTLEGIQQLRASNREQHYIRQVIASANQIRQSSAQFSWQSDAANRFSMAVFLLGFDVFRAISMLMVVYSDLSIGQMMAVFGYLWFMMGPVQELLNINYAFFAAKAALERLNKLMLLRQEPQYPHSANPFADNETVAIRLENIHFRYGRGPAVLNGVNLNIQAGEKVALVGASGGGKSTLVQVILGLYPTTKGMLYFNGAPITTIGLDIVRRNVATVLQQPAMFNDTVRHNLTLGAHIAETQLYEALAVAQLHDVVAGWPQQLDTLIGNQGIRLSGGQKQRLAIARMLLANPKVVILDEATSALDAQTELNLHQALNRFLRHRTTIIIAHRLSAVKQADRVYVFEDGQIAEQGAHDQLIKNNGLYSRLYGNLQR